MANNTNTLSVRSVLEKDKLTGGNNFLDWQRNLTVANPEAEIVYNMDHLKRRIANGDWVDVVDNAIKMYKEGLNRVAKKKILWENMAGVPLQTGSTDCGLFVMRHMKEIVEDKELQFAAKWMCRSNLVHTVDDINKIKIDIANFMKHHAC